jgi:lipopolysaccharide transport system permease protein
VAGAFRAEEAARIDQRGGMGVERDDATRVVRITPTRMWGFPNLVELWHARELVYFLVWRDIRVRYKQAVLGVAWVVFQPVASVAIYSLFFGQLLRVPSGDMPYPVFAYAGLMPWAFFAAALSRATGSLVGNANLLTKVYLPKLAIPISSVLSGFVDTGISFLVLIGLMLLFGVPLTLTALMSIPFLLLAVLTALGFGIWLGSLNVRYRDVGHLVPFFVQIWMYMTPVVYGSTLIPERFRFLLVLNPMTLVVEGVRWALLGQPLGRSAEPWAIAFSLVMIGTVLASGMVFFARVEGSFSDVV